MTSESDVMASSATGAVRLVSTCPPSGGARNGAEYLDHVRRVSTWSEAAGHEAILVYTDNRLVDPWLVAAEVVRSTERLCPLVAVQPVYMHPYTVAKMVATFAHLHGRKLWLNFVAGGFRNDLVALNDQTPHDQRYARVAEYVEIMTRLVKGETVTFDGVFYRVDNLRLTPSVDPELLPQIMLSGSSEAGLETARRLDAIAVQYPQPPAEYEAVPPAVDLVSGILHGAQGALMSLAVELVHGKQHPIEQYELRMWRVVRITATAEGRDPGGEAPRGASGHHDERSRAVAASLRRRSTAVGRSRRTIRHDRARGGPPRDAAAHRPSAYPGRPGCRGTAI
mgnify:CR=1 FL=1